MRPAMRKGTHLEFPVTAKEVQKQMFFSVSLSKFISLHTYGNVMQVVVTVESR